MATSSISTIGDHRDIPLTLGMISITWNSCELALRDMVVSLASAGQILSQRAVETIVVELGSVGLSQALNCLADEFPDENADISCSIKNISAFFERARTYRNYYIHGIRGITQYGFKLTEHDIDNDTPVHECFFEGPFGHIYLKSAKNKSKFTNDFIDCSTLLKFQNQIVDFENQLREVHITIRHYFRRVDYKKTAPLPPLLPLPETLVKPHLDHPKLRLPRALRHIDPRSLLEDDEPD